MTIPLVFCKGNVIKDYWRKEANIEDSIIINFFGSSESIEHYNAKIKISLDKQILDIKNNYLFIGYSSKTEYILKETNQKIDVVLFDENKNPLIGVEILCTNKKSQKDIEKFNKLNFPIYEYNINTKEIYPISAADTDTEQIKGLSEEIKTIEKSISESKKRIIKGREYIFRQLHRIKILKEGFKRTDDKSRKKWRDYYKVKESAEYLSQKGFDNVIRTQQESYKLLRECIIEESKQIYVDFNEEKAYFEIREIKSRIAAARRRQFEIREEYRKGINAI